MTQEHSDEKIVKKFNLLRHLIGFAFLIAFFFAICYIEGSTEKPVAVGIWENIKRGMSSIPIYKDFFIHFAAAIVIGFVVLLLLKDINDFALEEKFVELNRKLEKKFVDLNKK
ncbi:MAG TPA: hypothetical protein VK623_10795 [Flavobacterium sp.]|nr:hypothetical protein [Flavobacterium sp.]